MADAGQLAILKRGVAEWNEWRSEHQAVVVDLSGADLRGAHLENAHLSEAHLEWADLREAHLEGAQLREAHLENARLAWTHLEGAMLMAAYLEDANLMGAQLEHANLLAANLERAQLMEANLGGAQLIKANLTGACLIFADISSASVSNLTYNRKKMRGCYTGVRGLDSCHGNALFRRDAQDQDYLDALEQKCKGSWRGQLVFKAWGFIDYGRSIHRVAGLALLLVMIFGSIYASNPGLIDYGEHKVTPFTPFYFSFVTYTTLGFGDVTAGCLCGELLVTLEVVMGYLTLGLLLSILANTVARRS